MSDTLCPGLYCGRVNYGNGTFSECGVGIGAINKIFVRSKTQWNVSGLSRLFSTNY